MTINGELVSAVIILATAIVIFWVIGKGGRG